MIGVVDALGGFDLQTGGIVAVNAAVLLGLLGRRRGPSKGEKAARAAAVDSERRRLEVEGREDAAATERRHEDAQDAAEARIADHGREVDREVADRMSGSRDDVLHTARHGRRR